MNEVTRYVAGSIVLALVGGVYLAAGLLDRTIARSQQEFAAQHYDRADEALAAVEGYLEYGSWIPWIRRGPLSDVRTRRAAIRYWSAQYDRIERPEAGDAVPAEDIDLQLIAANTVYRRGQDTAADRREVLEALQAARSAYLDVLRSASAGSRSRASEVAAYNYEYVVRTRDDIDKGRRTPELTDTAKDGPAGARGTVPPRDPTNRDLKLLVPLDPAEMDKGVEPGRGDPIQRKG